jgi:hypothetical protein
MKVREYKFHIIQYFRLSHPRYSATNRQWRYTVILLRLASNRLRWWKFVNMTPKSCQYLSPPWPETIFWIQSQITNHSKAFAESREAFLLIKFLHSFFSFRDKQQLILEVLHQDRPKSLVTTCQSIWRNVSCTSVQNPKSRRPHSEQPAQALSSAHFMLNKSCVGTRN